MRKKSSYLEEYDSDFFSENDLFVPELPKILPEKRLNFYPFSEMDMIAFT